MSMLVKLQEAINNAEVLKIRYYGGSQPGTVREISPISILNGKVRARCFSSNAIKTFFIDKIELCDIDTITNWSKEVALKIEYTNLKEVYEKNLSELEKLGWHINLENNLISLHRRFKNGKLLKSPDVSLHFEEYTYDLIFYDEDDIRKENYRKRQRPWTVSAKNKETRTFGNLDKAVHFFIEEAKLLSPNYETL